ncbi:hypothetical protein DL89DRAFT_289700 [Linderina pennispora]|uniref:Uncharacterized protein n=1 Tax=Linderina pennispora TaxID=61395 RepID=A0A1Y1WKM7_9FUNG|nr:uncharacterized protein DL89DRAFT_289700 [Linderina pennispora]ORX74042.1 hypothetical protein DL89DRAFT_289700 [Linderina pennispora]
MGFQPAAMLGQSAYVFIADDAYKLDYPAVYSNDTASVLVMRLNAKAQDGASVATRLVAFNCDTCILAVAVMFPEQPAEPLPHLAVRQIDALHETQRAMAAAEAVSQQGIYVTQATQPKACFVLECPSDQAMAPGLVATPIGPSIVFVTNSVDRLLLVDGDELIGTPFLRLVAPESMVTASKFIDDLGRTDEIVFASFFLMLQPASGDELPNDRRVEVEVVGAQSDDGVVFLCRRIRVCAEPGMPSEVCVDEDIEDGYLSLAEIISSEPETSDCPSQWTSLA